MSWADIWDRFFWSAMLAVLVGIIWLRFVDPFLGFAPAGFLAVQVIAWGYFITALRRLKKEARPSREGQGSREA